MRRQAGSCPVDSNVWSNAPLHKRPTFCPTAAAFRQWFEAHAGTATELLVGFHKVGTGQPGMSWSESVDEALCFGCIDGVRQRIEEAAYSIRFTLKKPGSIWAPSTS